MTFTKNDFKTSDLAIVAYLWGEGCQLSRITSDGTKKFFVFDKSSLLSELVEVYWNRGARVEPLQYFSSLREVKNLIYRSN